MADKKSPLSENGKPDLDAIKMALEGLESPKVTKARERATQFAALYETIRDLIARGVSKRAILDKLAELGLDLNHLQFKKLLEAEAQSRNEPVPGKDAPDQAQLSDAQEKVAV